MRKSLGKFCLLFLVFIGSELFASTYVWSAYASKEEAFTNEAVHLKYSCEFSDRAELYAIDFHPVRDNEKYSIKLLSQNERIIDGKKVNTYEFVAFVKIAGKTSFEFNVTMKKTTKDSIENTVIGRDNVESEEFSKKLIKQKVLVVDVVDAKSDLVGDFTLEVKHDRVEVKAYEPYHMEIIIKGSGNFDAIKPYDFKIDGVKVFSGKPLQSIELTEDGFSGSLSQKFAFVSDKNFTIPELSFKYFDTKERTVKIMKAQQMDVKVSKAFVKEELLDEEEKKFEFSYEYIYYALTFLAGFLAAKIKFKKREKLLLKDELFKHKVEDAKSLEELAIVLALKDSKKYNDVILKIETKTSMSLGSLKKELLK